MSTELKVRIQLRHDTEENWISNNPVLLDGEAALTTDGENKGKLKFGDGTSNWNNLEYSTSNVVEVDATKVTFEDDMTFTYPFGKYSPDSSGQVEIPSTGKNLSELLLDAFAEESNPTITQPSVSVTSSQVKAYEAGTNITPQYTVNFNPGSYQYGPATGVTASSYSVTLDDQTLTTQIGTFTQIQVEDSTSLKISATVNHTEGATPLTNLGNDYAAGKIAAGSKSGSTSGTVTGYRQIFYGVDTTSGAINSALIRSLTAGGNKASARTITINAAEGATRIIVAIPQSANLKVTKATLTTSMNADITSTYVKQSDPVSVEGANGYTGVPYDIYVYQPASIDPGEVHEVVIGAN